MKALSYFSLVVIFLLPTQLVAQPDLTKLIQHLEFEEASELAQSILTSSAPDTEKYQVALYHLGVCQMNLQELDAAKQTFNRGLSLKDIGNHPWYWKGLAMLQHKALNYDSALFFYEKALQITEESDVFYLQLLIDKGNMLMVKEQYKQASELFFKAKESYDQSNFDSPYLKHLVHSYIGEYFLIKNDYKNAELNLKLALSIGEMIFNEDHPRMSELHESLGFTYIGLENKERMHYHYKRVYDINKKGKEKGSYDLIVANNIMGMSLLNAKSDQEAVQYLALAYNDMVTYFPNFDLGVHIVGLNLGIAYYRLAAYDKAKNYLHESVERGRKAYGNKAQTIAEGLGYLAQAYEDTGDFDMAKQVYGEGIAANALFKPAEQLSEFTEAVDILTLSFILQNRAQFYLKRYLKDTATMHLDLAKKDAELNLRILQRHQESLSPESRSSLSYELNFGYYISAEVNWYLYQLTKENQYVENMLNDIERSKSDYLRVSLALAETKAQSNIPEEILALDGELQIKKEALKAKIIAGENRGATSLPWDSLVLVQQQMDSLSQLMSAYVDTKYVYKWKSIRDLQNELNSSRAIVDYMLQEDILFQVLITKDKLFVSRDSVPDLHHQVITFRDEVQSVSETFTTRADLTQILTSNFEQLSSSINKLTIIPDGVLHYLPFDLLGKSDHYLLQSYDISYTNFIIETPSVDAPNDQLLSYAPDFGTDKLASLDVVRGDLAAIPGAFDEVSTINTLFNGETLTSSLATETSFKQKAKDFGLIHMATHAIVDDSDPEISRLVFNLSQDSLNDGYLHAYEIYNLKLNAKLVTLSACNTGYGKIERGEGVMSLSWAFAYAGVPSTVVSLWPASDKSTPELMKYFYQNLKEGQAKDEALNNARKSYLANAKGKARHPFYWGGFVLIGDNSPIEDNTNLLVYVIPVTLIIVMILTVYRRRRNQSS